MVAISNRFKHMSQQMLRLLVPMIVFFIALSGTLQWQKHMDSEGCGRCDEVCASLLLASRADHGAGFTLTRNEPALLLEDSAWRYLLAVITPLTHQPAASAYMLGALCGLITLLLGMQLAMRFGYHPMTRWFFGFALLFAPGWLPSLVEGHSTPLAAMLVMWAIASHVERMERHEPPLSLGLAAILACAIYVRLELAWLWVIFVLHYLLNASRNHERGSEYAFILVRGLAGILLLMLALLPLVAWHWPMLGWPPLRIPGAPLATENQPVWELILLAIPKAYARLVLSPYWSTWALMILALLGAMGLAWRAWRRREAQSAFIVPLALVLMPLFYALTYPLTGWPSSDVVFAAFDPIGALACAIAASRVPDWIARLLRRRYFLHAHWMAALRVAACLVLAIAAMLESIHWNSQWSAETHARIRTRNALKHLLATAGEQQPLLLTDEPGWALWETRAAVVDISGRLTPDFIRHRNGHDSLAVDKLRARLKSAPVAYAIVREGTAKRFVENLGFVAVSLPASAVDHRFPQPVVYRFKHPAVAGP